MREMHPVRIERSLPVPAARLYRAWTDPRELARWAWAGIGTDVQAEVDLRVGGRYSIYTTVEDARGWHSNRQGMCGLYVEIIPSARLVYTLHWDAPVGYNESPKGPVLDEIVAVDFTGGPGGSTLRFQHLGIPDAVSARGHEQGENAALDLLERMLADPETAQSTR